MKNVLITGPSGFVGFHLVQHLSQIGANVSCLVRKSSNRKWIQSFEPQFVVGDVLDKNALQAALASGSFDTVFHLAGLTKSLQTKRLFEVNELGTRNLAEACGQLPNPPKLVVLSSLAARGPDDRASDGSAKPVSAYGKSKLAGELAAREFADRIPVSIIRAPIVLGEADSDGLTMFQSIQNFALHLVPGFFDKHYSVVYAGDLAKACELVATDGERASADTTAHDGIYYPADDEVFTYAGLGRAIGNALGKKRTWMIRFPAPIVWMVAAGGEVTGQIRRSPSLLNLDKAREATGGSWTCNGERLRRELGFKTDLPIAKRLELIITWYRENGWLR